MLRVDGQSGPDKKQERLTAITTWQVSEPHNIDFRSLWDLGSLNCLQGFVAPVMIRLLPERAGGFKHEQGHSRRGVENEASWIA
jgi:hypothetical protein